MDKEVEQIMEEIEESLAITRDAERGHWALSTDKRAQLPQHVRADVDFLSR